MDPTENDSRHVDCKNGDVVPKSAVVVTYVEFYSGIGGWTMAVHQALERVTQRTQQPETSGNRQSLRLKRLATLDHSDLCQSVFQHNFGPSSSCASPTNKKRKRKQTATKQQIERLSLEQVEEWNATIWVMSPPCQPHTRQHNNNNQDLQDPRSRSFLRLCELLKTMEETTLPRAIMMENVVGFERSGSCQQWRKALSQRNYVVAHFHLNPTQVGIPNDRPRYYSVAVREHCLLLDDCDALHCLFDNNEEFCRPPTIQTSIDAIGVHPNADRTLHYNNLPPISTFLDPPQDQDDSNKSTLLAVPDKILQSTSSWCFDIVTPKDRRSACFTQSYGKFVRGTGSVLYTGPLEKGSESQRPKVADGGDDCETNQGDTTRSRLEFESPEERQYDPNWSQGLDLKRHLRYFSGTEIARLMGFPVTTAGVSGKTRTRTASSFEFPDTCTMKQQWKLLGNSINVCVAARVAEVGLRVTNFSLEEDIVSDD